MKYSIPFSSDIVGGGIRFDHLVFTHLGLVDCIPDQFLI